MIRMQSHKMKAFTNLVYFITMKLQKKKKRSRKKEHYTYCIFSGCMILI